MRQIHIHNWAGVPGPWRALQVPGRLVPEPPVVRRRLSGTVGRRPRAPPVRDVGRAGSAAHLSCATGLTAGVSSFRPGDAECRCAKGGTVITVALPDHASLEQLRKQARDLQRAVRAGAPEALAEVAEGHRAGCPDDAAAA